MLKILTELKITISLSFLIAFIFILFLAKSGQFVITGLILAYLNGYLHQAMTFSEGFWPIGVGMWLGIIMLFNVWGVIWPNQKRALGIIEVDADTKAKAAKKAMLFSRTNTLLSIPMLVGMTVAQNGFA